MDDLLRLGKSYFAETFIGLKFYDWASTKVPLYYSVILAYALFIVIRWAKERFGKKYTHPIMKGRKR
jgi:hypothetical protein